MWKKIWAVLKQLLLLGLPLLLKYLNKKKDDKPKSDSKDKPK